MPSITAKNKRWPGWKTLLGEALSRPEELADFFPFDHKASSEVAKRYPFRLNHYYLSLIEKPFDPIWRQAVPDPLELNDQVGLEDSLAEERFSPTSNLIHKYPDRALLLAASGCAMYCRFCTRKRKVGKGLDCGRARLQEALDYLADTPQICDVLVSGGDPLLLEDEELCWLLNELRKIKHIEIIRIGSRVPCTLPQRVDRKLARMLKRFHPLFINTHFNHPRELSPEAAKACMILADAGIPLGNQCVLLKDVNNDAAIIKKLMRGLLRLRVKPYYLFQADLSRGTEHFRTPISQGIEIAGQLVGHCSGMAVPTLALDCPDGLGKIPLGPEFVTGLANGQLDFVNYQGEKGSYPDACG